MAVNTQYNNNLSTLIGSLSSVYQSSYAKQTSASSLLSSLSGTSSLFGGTSASVDYSALSYVSNVKSGANDLNSAIKSLTSGDAFKKNSVSASDSAAMSIKSTSKNPDFKNTMVQIDQVASGQVNEGNALNADSKLGTGGNYAFSIEKDGKSYDFKISVSASDTNMDLQQKMADAINEKKIGVTAQVNSDETKGTSALTISADNTGDSDENRFTIKDVSGNAVSKTGVDNVKTDAQDAIYSINGGAKVTSSSNEISLGDGITATLKKATDEAVTVSKGADKTGIIDTMRKMVESFNGLLETALDNEGDQGAGRLMNSLTGIAKTYASSLEKIGVEVSSSGVMSINEKKLVKAVDDGSAEKFLTQNSGANYGFGNRLSRVAGDIENNTGKYMGNSFASYAANGADMFSGFANMFGSNSIGVSQLFNYLA